MKKSIRSSIFPNLRTMTSAAMLTAMSVVIGIFCKNFLNFGGGLFRITFENLPVILAGILYGPLAGGVVGAASDLVSYLLSSQAYPPNLIVTLGAFASGFIAGIVPRYLLRRRGLAQIILSGSMAHLVASLLIKSLGLYQYYGALVIWRIPLYLIIAPLEILILCMLLRNKTVQRLVGYSFKEKP